MNTFADVVEKVSSLSIEELEEIKMIVDKQLTDRRLDEIEKSLAEARKESGTFVYYTSGEDLVSSLNEEQ